MGECRVHDDLLELGAGPNRLVRSRFGPMLVNGNDKYVGRSLIEYGEFSYPESEFFAQILRAGQVVVEAGANIGAHTIQLARLVGDTGTVLAFEPQRFVFQLLCANLALNQLTNVLPNFAAVGEASGQISVPDLDPRTEQNFGGVGLREMPGEIVVPLVAIDDLGLHQCHLIKADVEGMEKEVLVGARETIERLRPILFVENDRPEHSFALLKTMLELDYRLWWHASYLFNPDNFNGNGRDLFPGLVSCNVVGVPRERVCEMTGMKEIMAPDERHSCWGLI